MKEFLEEIKTIEKKLKDFKKDLFSAVQDVMVEAAEETSKDIVSRIKTTGVIAEGDREVRLTGYSLQGKKGTRWRDKREKAGKQTGYKDLHFSGAMMGSMRVEKAPITDNTITVFSGVSGGGKKPYSDIVKGLSKQEGISNYVTDPTKSELNKFDEKVDAVISELINKLGI